MFLFSFFNSLCIYYWGDFMFLILTVSHTSPTAEAAAQCNCANVVLITANYQSRGRILHTALQCGITQSIAPVHMSERQDTCAVNSQDITCLKVQLFMQSKS